MDKPNSHSHNVVRLGFDNENENDGEAGWILLSTIRVRMYSILKREMVRAGSEASAAIGVTAVAETAKFILIITMGLGWIVITRMADPPWQAWGFGCAGERLTSASTGGAERCPACQAISGRPRASQHPVFSSILKTPMCGL